MSRGVFPPAPLKRHRVFGAVSASLDRLVGSSAELVVVAVSGGSDSTALALLVSAWASARQVPVVFAYFHHGVDPARHAAEWAQVVELARWVGAPAVWGGSSMFASVGGASREEVWRNRRYAFLSLVAGRGGTVVVGHTMDDVAETFVWAAARGGYGHAREGPRERVGNVVRPLLAVRRSALRDLLSSLGVPWVEDPTNREGTRGVLRAQVIPSLESVVPRAVEGLARSARVAAELSEALDDLVAQATAKAVRDEGDHVYVDGRVLGGFPMGVRRRVVTQVVAPWVRGRGLVWRAVDHVLRLCQGEGERESLSEGILAQRYRSLVRIGPAGDAFAGGQTWLPTPGRTTFGPWALTCAVAWGSLLRVSLSKKTRAVMDLDRVHLPLSVRARSPGDRVQPLGMRGTVRVNRYLRDMGIPPWERWALPVVCDARGRILWIPGVVQSALTSVDQMTRRVLLLNARTEGE